MSEIKRSRTRFRVPFFLRPEGQIQATGDALLAHGGIRTREIRGVEPHRTEPTGKDRRIHSIATGKPPSAYTLEYPRAPLRPLDTQALRVPCNHILLFYMPFFTEKKLRTLI